ncbi:MAG: DUF2102 domain-containing protein [Nitrososphaerota archaeon]
MANEERKALSVKVFLSLGSGLSPKNLLKEVTNLEDVRAKETCYGLLISGDPDRVERVAKHLRESYPHDIFIKECGPKLRSRRIFTGFLQTAGEYRTLLMLSHALRQADEGHHKDGGICVAPPLGLEISRLKLMRCPLFPNKNVEVLLLHLKNGDVIVRCPDGKRCCIWYNSITCPYGMLEHNLHRWYYAKPAYWTLQGDKAD